MATVDHFAKLIHKEILSGELPGFIEILECLKPALKGKNAESAIMAAGTIARIGKFYERIIEIE